MSKQDKIDKIKLKLKDAWLRGKAQRIEVGSLLLELRKEVEHGEWGKLLIELGIPTSTAADYMQEASRQIYGIRKFENGEVKDAEEEQMQLLVAAATAEVNQVAPPIPIESKKPPEAKVELDDHNRVKGPALYCT